jgi:hypothetical protein
VTPPRQVPHYRQRPRGFKVVETAMYELCALRIVPPDDTLVFVPVLRIIVDRK